MTNSLTEFDAAFRVQELLIHETDHWRWSLRPQQPTLAAGVLSLKEYQTRLSDMPEGAGADYQLMVGIIERTLKKAFGYDKINHLMLMMVDSHVHYHILPRYGREVEFGGKVWTDPGWPLAPDLGTDQMADDPEMAGQLVSLLRENLQK